MALIKPKPIPPNSADLPGCIFDHYRMKSGKRRERIRRIQIVSVHDNAVKIQELERWKSSVSTSILKISELYDHAFEFIDKMKIVDRNAKAQKVATSLADKLPPVASIKLVPPKVAEPEPPVADAPTIVETPPTFAGELMGAAAPVMEISNQTDAFRYGPIIEDVRVGDEVEVTPTKESNKDGVAFVRVTKVTSAEIFFEVMDRLNVRVFPQISRDSFREPRFKIIRRKPGAHVAPPRERNRAVVESPKQEPIPNAEAILRELQDMMKRPKLDTVAVSNAVEAISNQVSDLKAIASTFIKAVTLIEEQLGALNDICAKQA